MSEDGARAQKHEVWKEFSEGQVAFLRGLRKEISSRRWEIMLEIDSIQELVRLALSKTEDKELCNVLSQILGKSDNIHRSLARIPEDIIPAF
jgi:hypothetical protein